MEYDRTRTQKDYHPSRMSTPWAKLSRRTGDESDKIGMVGTSSRSEKLFLALDCRLVPDRQKLSGYALTVEDKNARPYPGQRMGQSYVTITLFLEDDCYDGTSCYGEYAFQCNYQGKRRLEPRFDQVKHCSYDEMLKARSILQNPGPSFVTRSDNTIKVRVYKRGSSIPVHLSTAPDSATDYFADWPDLDDIKPASNPCNDVVFPPHSMAPNYLQSVFRDKIASWADHSHRVLEEQMRAFTPQTTTQPTEGTKTMTTTRNKQNAVVRPGTGYALCKFAGSSKEYTYFCADNSVAVGDFVVVSTPNDNHGSLCFSKEADGYLAVVQVTGRTPTAAQKARATHSVVSRVALGEYQALVTKADRTEELNEAIRSAAVEAEERARLNALAAHSPELKALLAERDQVTKGNNNDVYVSVSSSENTLGNGGTGTIGFGG